MDKVTIGNNTLYCGDCREVINDLQFDSIITDPPYGLSKLLKRSWDDFGRIWNKRQRAPGSLEEQVLMSGETPCWDWNRSPANPRNKKPYVPTPRAQDALNRTNPCQYRRGGVPLAAWVCMFPTPTANGMCGGTGGFRKLKELMGKGVITPKERRGMAAGNGGKLNPLWTEWLMAFPIGWSGLKPLATPKSRSAPQPDRCSRRRLSPCRKLSGMYRTWSCRRFFGLHLGVVL